MSRNPEYQFVSTDTDELIADLVKLYQSITGRTLSPASPERVFVQWVANALLIALRSTNYVGNQNIPSRADGQNLDELGQLFQNVRRPEAQPAVSTMRIHLEAPQDILIPIPIGTRFTDIETLVRWETSSDALVEIGHTFVDVPIVSKTLGIDGNGWALGQINILMDVTNVPAYERCENITVSEGGVDEATDEEYYELLRASQDSYSTAGARGSYIYHAKKVSTEIADVVPNSPSAGQVDIYVLMNDGTIAGEEIKNKVYEACTPDDVRPLTDYVTIKDPERVEYDINFKYFIMSDSQRSLVETGKAVESGVNEYISWQAGKLGRDINPDELRKFVRRASGVKRLEIITPVFEVLRDGKNTDEEKQPQIASVRTVNIVNGGYEDE